MLRSGFAPGWVEMADFPGTGGGRASGFAAEASGKAPVQEIVVCGVLFLVLRHALREVPALDQLRPLGRSGGVPGRLPSAFHGLRAAFVPP